MQYKFDRKYLHNILLDSEKQYKNKLITKDEYDLLQIIIKNLIYGEKIKKIKLTPDNLDVIGIKLNIIKNELGNNIIEDLLYISDSIIRNSSYYRIPCDFHKQSSEELVKKVLEFYHSCNEEQFNYLNSFANQRSQLEIVNKNFINKKYFETNIQALPLYNLEYVRVLKENRLYDEAGLCHEFRHILDIQKLNINALDLNVFSETNPIAMELYYQMSKLKEDKNYKAGIIERLNYIRYMAIRINSYMDLLIQIDNYNRLKKSMIVDAFKVNNKKQYESVLKCLSKDSAYEEISYFIGGLKGIYLCMTALEDPNASLELQDKLCSLMVTDRFIPKNIESVLGKDFIIGENDIEAYKKFIKKLNN